MEDTLRFENDSKIIEFQFDFEGDLWIDIDGNREGIDYCLKPDEIVKLITWLLTKKTEAQLEESHLKEWLKRKEDKFFKECIK